MFWYRLKDKYPKYRKYINFFEILFLIFIGFFFSFFLYLLFIFMMDMPTFIDYITQYFSRWDTLLLWHVYWYSNLRASWYRFYIWSLEWLQKIIRWIRDNF